MLIWLAFNSGFIFYPCPGLRILWFIVLFLALMKHILNSYEDSRIITFLFLLYIPRKISPSAISISLIDSSILGHVDDQMDNKHTAWFELGRKIKLKFKQELLNKLFLMVNSIIWLLVLKKTKLFDDALPSHVANKNLVNKPFYLQRKVTSKII